MTRSPPQGTMHVLDPVADLAKERRLSGTGLCVVLEDEHRFAMTIRRRVLGDIRNLRACTTIELYTREPVLVGCQPCRLSVKMQEPTYEVDVLA